LTDKPSFRIDPTAAAADSNQVERRDFALMLTHDIKNHLSMIVGFVEMLRRGDLSEAGVASTLDRIESNAHQATNLTVDFLRAEEMDCEGLRIHTTESSLNALVEEIVRHEEPLARLRNVGLRLTVDFEVPAMPIDVAMLGSAITNLIANAVRHSRSAASVDVTICRSENGATVAVRDYGSGIAPEELANLFKRFGRGTNPTFTHSTGLGLYIVKMVVEAHGGSIEAMSPPDGGSAFTILLPGRSKARIGC
jgi:signal transduction histidine kinase